MPIRPNQPLGIELAKRRIISEEDIEKALEYQRKHPNKKLGDIIYILKLCDPYLLIDAIADILDEKATLLEESAVKINVTDYISLDIAKKSKGSL